MKKQGFVFLVGLLFFSLSAVTFSEDDPKQCAEDAVSSYWLCHQNAQDKASRGNFSDFTSNYCEDNLVPKIKACYGDVKITDCQKKVINRYYYCQSNLNDKYYSGNLDAGSSDECTVLILNGFENCEKTKN